MAKTVFLVARVAALLLLSLRIVVSQHWGRTPEVVFANRLPAVVS
jgi:hypothetical protein